MPAAAEASIELLDSTGQEAARGRQEQSVDRRHRGARRLPTEDAEFVLQHDDFKLLEVV